MIPLANKTNVTIGDPDYPFGKSQDVTTSGAGNGTPIDFVRFNDWDQLMEKIMEASGITPNGQPDNESDGFQLWEAFRRITRPYRTYQAIIEQSGTTAPTVTQVLLDELGDITFGYNGVGVYTLDSSGSQFTSNKTVILLGKDGNPNENFQTSVAGTSQIQLYSYLFSGGSFLPTNNLMQSIFVEVRVFD